MSEPSDEQVERVKARWIADESARADRHNPFEDDELRRKWRAGQLAFLVARCRLHQSLTEWPVMALANYWGLTWEEVARCCAREDLVWWMTQQLTKGGAT